MYGLVRKIAQIIDTNVEATQEDTIPINAEMEGYIYLNSKEIPSIINIIKDSVLEIGNTKEYKPEITFTPVDSKVVLVDTANYGGKKQKALFFDYDTEPCLPIGKDVLEIEEILEFCENSDLVFSTRRGVYSVNVLNCVQEEVK